MNQVSPDTYTSVMANILRRKVYPHDVATGESDTRIGKAAALAVGVLGLTALVLIGRAVAPVHVGDDLELTGWSEHITDSADGCIFTGTATLRNTGDKPFTLTHAELQLTMEEVVPIDRQAAWTGVTELTPDASASIDLVNQVGGSCPASAFIHGPFNLSFTHADAPATQRNRWITTD